LWRGVLQGQGRCGGVHTRIIPVDFHHLAWQCQMLLVTPLPDSSALPRCGRVKRASTRGVVRRHSQAGCSAVWLYECGTTQGDLRARTRSVGIGVGVFTGPPSSGVGASRPRAWRLPKAHTTPSSSAASVCCSPIATAAILAPTSASTRFGVACGVSTPWPRLYPLPEPLQVKSSPFSVTAHEASSSASASVTRSQMSVATRRGVCSALPWPLAHELPHP